MTKRKFKVGDVVKANGIVLKLTVWAEDIDRWAGEFFHRGGQNTISGHISQADIQHVEGDTPIQTEAPSAVDHTETQPELRLEETKDVPDSGKK